MFKSTVSASIRPISNAYLVTWNDPNQNPGPGQNQTLAAADMATLKTLLHAQVDTLTEEVITAPPRPAGGIVTGQATV